MAAQGGKNTGCGIGGGDGASEGVWQGPYNNPLLRPLKLKGQNLPRCACLRHSEKIVVWGTRKHRDIKSNKK